VRLEIEVGNMAAAGLSCFGIPTRRIVTVTAIALLVAWPAACTTSNAPKAAELVADPPRQPPPTTESSSDPTPSSSALAKGDGAPPPPPPPRAEWHCFENPALADDSWCSGALKQCEWLRNDIGKQRAKQRYTPGPCLPARQPLWYYWILRSDSIRVPIARKSETACDRSYESNHGYTRLSSCTRWVPGEPQ